MTKFEKAWFCVVLLLLLLFSIINNLTIKVLLDAQKEQLVAIREMRITHEMFLKELSVE